MCAVAFSASEIVSRGQRLYEANLRAQLEPAHRGEVAVINIDTGEFEVDPQRRTAVKRAHARWPGGKFFAVRVGFPSMGHIGAGFRTKAK